MKRTRQSSKFNTFILILVAGILLTCSNLTPSVNAQPIHTSLTIAVSYGPPWEACTLEATLKDENSNPLQNFNIVFWCKSDGGTLLLGIAKTDSNGVASQKDIPLIGTYKVNATFSGTTNYASSSSEYIEITIIDYTPYLVGGGLIAVAIVGAVGYIVFRRRKKAKTMPKTAKGEKKTRINLLQIGFSIIMGWGIVLVSNFLQPGLASFWIVFLLGEIFIVLGFVEKERVISTRRAKVLLQIGVVITMIWVVFFLQMEGPYDLGLPKIYVPTGYTPDGEPISTPLTIILFIALPVLGLILLALGIVLNRIKKG